jgi:hypothetical protein
MAVVIWDFDHGGGSARQAHYRSSSLRLVAPISADSINTRPSDVNREATLRLCCQEPADFGGERLTVDEHSTSLDENDQEYGVQSTQFKAYQGRGAVF